VTLALASCQCNEGGDGNALRARGDAGDAGPAVGPRGPLRLLTLNVANGAGDRFRTAEHRARQGAFLAASGADVATLQEVDLGADRSGNVDVAAEIAAAITPALAGCPPEVPAPPHVREDGTVLRRCAGGAVLFATAFRGDDPFHLGADGLPGGIMDADEALNPKGTDRGADAFYGHAMVVRAPFRVDSAYTLSLPVAATSDLPPAELLAALASGSPSADTLRALAIRNVENRRLPAIEPRAALVAHVTSDASGPLVIIGAHLETFGATEIRRRQLEAVLAIARAELVAAPGRHVAIMGDLNTSPDELAPTFAAASFVRAAAPPDPAVFELDQIWVDPGLVVMEAARRPATDVSDHTFAATTMVRRP